MNQSGQSKGLPAFSLENDNKMGYLPGFGQLHQRRPDPIPGPFYVLCGVGKGEAHAVGGLTVFAAGHVPRRRGPSIGADIVGVHAWEVKEGPGVKGTGGALAADAGDVVRPGHEQVTPRLIEPAHLLHLLFAAQRHDSRPLDEAADAGGLQNNLPGVFGASPSLDPMQTI